MNPSVNLAEASHTNKNILLLVSIFTSIRPSEAKVNLKYKCARIKTKSKLIW